ncbi:MAG: multidrug effflux MFS transporter [Xanthobacteraceae bacterium]|nr:multidrug effflux MFS transporter [Xanthobacteraceae bacterium]
MMVNVLSIDMTLPAMPALGAAFSATPDQIQLTLSLYLAGYAAGQIFIGPLSDRFGRRRVLVGCLAMYSLATLACAASPRIGFLIAARLLQGIFASGGPVMVRAIVRDHFEGARAAHTMSSLTTVFAVGPLLAPIIGGALLVRYGWPSIFLFIVFWSLVLLVFAWALLAESLREPDLQALQPSRIIANYHTFFTTRAAIGYAGLNGLCSLGMFAFLSGSPFVLIEIYGVAPNHYGYYFGLSALTLMLGASTNKRLLQWMPGERVMRYGCLTLILGGAAAVAIPFSPLNGPLALTVAIMIYIFGQMLVQPNAVAAALMPLPHMAGTGSALMGMMQMLFGALGGYAVNALYDGTPLPMTSTLLVAGIACSGLSLLLRR